MVDWWPSIRSVCRWYQALKTLVLHANSILLRWSICSSECSPNPSTVLFRYCGTVIDSGTGTVIDWGTWRLLSCMHSTSRSAITFFTDLERKDRLDIGLKLLFNDSQSRWLFFRMGVIIAVFIVPGIPSCRHMLATAVTCGIRVCAQSSTDYGA